MRSLVVIAVGLALGVGSAAVVIAKSHDGREAAQPRPVKLREAAAHEANRRVLTPAQTRRLVRYAGALHACLAKRGMRPSAPVRGSRAITIKTAADVGVDRLVERMTPCVAPLGDPPKPSSLQAVDARTIVLSVPKQCLLDPKTEA